MLSGLLLGLMALMRLCPSVPMVRTIHAVIVEMPAMWLARAERRHVIVILLVAAMIIGGGELLAVFGSFDVMLAFSIDLSLYLDAVGAMLAVAAATRVRTSYQLVKARFVAKRDQPVRGFMPGRAREIRSRRVRRSVKKDNIKDRPARQAA